MPNHVKSKITFEGDKETIQKLMEHVIVHHEEAPFKTYEGSLVYISGKDRYWVKDGKCTDHNRKECILPDGAELEMEEAFDQFDFAKIVPVPDNIYQGDLGPKEKEKYGENNWYDWNCNNWGTKWNSYSCQVLDNNIVEFKTAWSAPYPVIEALSSQYPELKIIHEYADEDMGYNCGIVIFTKDGEETELLSGSKEGMELAMKLWYREDEYKWNEVTQQYEYMEEENAN